MKIKIKKGYAVSAAAACALFLMLPGIFSDEPAPLRAPAVGTDGDSPAFSLPVIVSENPLTKYLRKAGEFYGLTKKQATAFGRGRGVLPPAPEEDYTDEERAQFFASYARERIAQKAAPPPPRQDGEEQTITVQPDEKGYYYEGRYYKNGAYPAPELKKQIESSITKFHAAQAEKQGKKAAYVLQDDGSLWVKYMPQAELDKKLNASPFARGGVGGTFYASGNIYDGARVASKKESDRASYSGAGKTDVSADINSPEIFNRAEHKIAEIQKDSRQQQQQAFQPAPAVPMPVPPKTSDNNSKDSAQAALDALDKFDRNIFRSLRPRSQDWDNRYDEGMYAGRPIYIDDILYSHLDNLFTQINNEDKQLCAPIENCFNNKSVTTFNAAEPLEKAIDSDDDLQKRFYSPTSVTPTLFRQLYNNKSVFFDFLSSPAYDPDTDREASYTELYYKKSGLEQILKEMEVNDDARREVASAYEGLDKRRKEMEANLKEFFDKNPSLKNLNVKIFYLLGKDGDKIIVGNRGLQAYGTVPVAVMPDGEVYEPREIRNGRITISVARTPQELEKDISAPGQIPTLFVLGEDRVVFGRKATGLDLNKFTSGLPDDLREIQRKRGKAMWDNVQNYIDEETKAKIKAEADRLKKAAAEKKQQAEALKKATEKAKKAADEVIGPPAKPPAK